VKNAEKLVEMQSIPFRTARYSDTATSVTCFWLAKYHESDSLTDGTFFLDDPKLKKLRQSEGGSKFFVRDIALLRFTT
jgi:hypothetical protein